MFGRARDILSRKPASAPPLPQYFALPCAERHTIRGLRTESYQALRCPTCGGGIFVLPRCPLPELPADAQTADEKRRPVPAAVSTSPRAQALASEADDPEIIYKDPLPPPVAPQVNIVWLDDEPHEPQYPAAPSIEHEIPEEYLTPAPMPEPEARDTPTPTRPRPARDARVPNGRRKKVVFVDDEPEEEPLPEPRPPVSQRLQGWFGRNRGWLLFLGAAALVASTLAYRVWRGYREQLPHIADVNWNEGQEAFDHGEFDLAKQKLARAASAFRSLGGTDERTQQSAQLAAEAAIFADLSSYRLDEILDEAARASPDEWKRRFDAVYKGRAFIIDSEIEGPPPPAASAGAYPLVYRVFVGRENTPARTGVIDLNGFKLFEGQELRKGDSVLFGARLAGLELQGKQWQFTLEPESGVLLSRFENLKQLGWPPRESVSVEVVNPRDRSR